MEGHIEQDEDDEEDDRNEDLQPLFRADLKLVLAGPLQRVPRWWMEVPDDCGFGLVYVTADVARDRVDVHVAGELGVLIAHHRGTRRQLNGCELTEWHI